MGQIRLPAGGLANLRRAIEENAGSSAVPALREAGRRLASDAQAVITQNCGGTLPNLPMTRFWDELQRYFSEAGWGSIEHERVNGAIGALVTSEWAEVDSSDSRDFPSCHITTGLLAELLSEAVGQPVAVLQVQCISRGDSVCRFLFGSPTTLLSIHQRLAHSDTLENALSAFA